MSYVKQSAVTFATQVTLMVFGIASGIVVARTLGPTLKGQASLLVTANQLLFTFGTLGLGSAFSFFIAKRRYPARQIMTLAWVSAAVLGGLAFGGFLLSWPLHAAIWLGIPDGLVIWASALAVMSILALYMVRVVVGHGWIYTMNAASFARSSVLFLAVVGLVACAGLGLWGYVAALYVAAIAQLVVLFVRLRRDLAPAAFWKSDLLRGSFGYGIKSHALIVILFLNYRLDLFLLKSFTHDDTAVGYYSLAVGMAEMMWLAPNATVAPLFAGVARSDTRDRSIITLRTCRWSAALLAVMAIGVIVLGRPMIRLLYGAEFLPSYEACLWLLPGVCLFPFFKLVNVDLAARGHPGYGTIASFVALLVNIAANVVLIPRLGIVGAALATSLSYSVMACLGMAFFLHVTGYRLEDVLSFDTEERAFVKHSIQNRLQRFGWKVPSPATRQSAQACNNTPGDGVPSEAATSATGNASHMRFGQQDP